MLGRRTWLIIAAAAALFALPTAFLLARAADRRTADRERLARAVDAERERLTRLQAPRRGAARDLVPAPGASRDERLAARAALVRRVERAITSDARRRARDGEIRGPIPATSCGPLLKDPEAVPDHEVLARTVGRYDCVAIRRDVRNTQRSVAKLGYAFVAALDFRRFTYVWCRNTPPQGEAGKVLVSVRLERACLAARGRPLSTGYENVPDP